MHFKLVRVSDTEILIEGEDGFQITLYDNPMRIKVGNVVVPLQELLEANRNGRPL